MLILGDYSESSPYLKEFTKHFQAKHPEFNIELIQLKQLKRFRFVEENFEENLIFKNPNGLINKLLDTQYLRSITAVFIGFFYFLFKAPKYELVCMQYVSFLYAFWIDVIKLKAKSITAVLWGSDFYRANAKFGALYKYIYYRSNSIIIGTKKSKSNFIKKYPKMTSKTFWINFGNDKLYQTLIDEKLNTNLLRKKWLEAQHINKHCISIGYNNRNAQQHIRIIRNLDQLSPQLKSNLLLIMPLTYPKDEAYKQKIKLALEKIDVPYLIIDHYLSEKEIIELRVISDLYINMQITDMFSSSVLEYMALDTIVINGNWLPYSYIQDNEIHAYTANWDNLTSITSDIIQNLETERKKLFGNREKIRDLINWNLLIPSWTEYLRIEKLRNKNYKRNRNLF